MKIIFVYPSLPEPMFTSMLRIPQKHKFSGIVNLEVFTPDHLNGSIAVLLKTIEAINGTP
jgi:hypothetical protein